MKIRQTPWAALCAAAALAAAGAAQAVEFRSADVHNSDDYPTVAAVKHMSETLAKPAADQAAASATSSGVIGPTPRGFVRFAVSRRSSQPGRLRSGRTAR